MIISDSKTWDFDSCTASTTASVSWHFIHADVVLVFCFMLFVDVLFRNGICAHLVSGF